MLEIRHPNGIRHSLRTPEPLRLPHPRGIARDDRPDRGVGSTGLTGPHLHFEVLVGGRQRDPRVALKSVEGAPVSVAERSAFEQARDRILAYLDSPTPGVAKLALR